MGDIFFASIHTCQASSEDDTDVGSMHRITALTAGIFPAGATAAMRDVTVALAALTSGNYGMFLDAEVHPFDRKLTELKQTFEQFVPQEKVRVYSESFEENLIFIFWHNSAHKALGRTHLINRPITVVLDNGLTPSGHALDQFLGTFRR